MKAVYKLHFDCGRMGQLDGLFIAEKERVNELISSGRKVCFGEVPGKHSEVVGPIEEPDDITFLSDDKEVVRVIEEHDLQSGYNPFDYIGE